ncbi:MAG TPA: hypothetical protein PLZ57_08960 [Pseudobdellovibrionaceae bacterium]|nr:hypothetical protein [Pseudobdellovibrionaceae bacterium]
MLNDIKLDVLLAYPSAQVYRECMGSERQMDSTQNWVWLLGLLLGAILVAYGVTLPIDDSEIWSVTSSQKIFEPTAQPAHMKPLTSLVLATWLKFAPDNWSALEGARIIFSGFAALTLMLAIGIAAQRSRRSLFLIVLVASLTPLFLNHAPRIRADIFAALIGMCGLWAISQPQRRLNFLGFLISSTLMMAASPKSLDLVLYLALILGLKFKLFSEWRYWLLPLVSIALIALLLPTGTLGTALIYSFDAYKGGGLFDTLFVQMFFRESSVILLLVLFCIAGLPKYLDPEFSESAEQYRWRIGAILLLIFVLIQPQKFPYYLASRWLFIVLGALPMMEVLAQIVIEHWPLTRDNRRGHFIAALALCIAIASLLQLRTAMQKEWLYTQGQQRLVYQQLEDYMEQSRWPNYWDVIGLFPLRNKIFNYPSPGDRANLRMLDWVEEQAPLVVLDTSRTGNLQPQFGQWLSHQYVPVNSQIWIRALRLEKCRVYKFGEVAELARQQKIWPPYGMVIRTDQGWNRAPIQALRPPMRTKAIVRKSDRNAPPPQNPITESFEEIDQAYPSTFSGEFRTNCQTESAFVQTDVWPRNRLRVPELGSSFMLSSWVL